MRNICAALLALVLTSLSRAEETHSLHSYKRYAVRPSATEPTAPLRLTRQQDREFETALRQSYRRRANFAGHHVLATIGCGASCVLVAALDKRSGRVSWLPFTVCCWPEPYQEPVRFRADSELLVLHGQRDEQGSAGPHYYRFHGGTFEPVESSLKAAAH